MKRTRRQALIIVGTTVTGTFALQEYARRKEPTDYPTDADSGAAESEDATTRAYEREEPEPEPPVSSVSEPEASVEILGIETSRFELDGGTAKSVDSVRVHVENRGEVPVAPHAEVESLTHSPHTDSVLGTLLGSRDFDSLEPGQSREARITRTNEGDGVVPPGGSVLHVVRLFAGGDELARDERLVEA